MKKIEQATQKRLELANPPQMIEQDELSPDYVNKKKVEAETALHKGKAGTCVSTIDGYPLYHYRSGMVSGIWFISQDEKTVDYLYAYQGVNLKSPVGQKASEALAYLFNPTVRGVTRDVFFKYLLPDLKFVITDSQYTPDGKRWFEAQYNHAFGQGLRVYSLDMTTSKLEVINKAKFYELQPLYWGKDKLHQKYRFAIEIQ